jgi:hypothetical protein
MKLQWKQKNTMLLVFMVLIYVGCAFGNRHVELSYPPEKKTEEGVAVADAAVIPKDRGLFLNVMPFTDVRGDQLEIGCVRNGLGMKTAQVIADNSVSDWVTMATIVELENAGFKVSRVEKIDAQMKGPVIEGEVVKVYCDAYFSYGGEVILSANMVDGEKKILDKTYTGKGSTGTNWAAGSEAYGQSLSLALRDAISLLVNDISMALVD